MSTFHRNVYKKKKKFNVIKTYYDEGCNVFQQTYFKNWYSNNFPSIEYFFLSGIRVLFKNFFMALNTNLLDTH